jgi:hypothetical protein
MTNIDKQRIAAVRTLEGLGFTFAGGEWKAPEGTRRHRAVVHTERRRNAYAGHGDTLLQDGGAEETDTVCGQQVDGLETGCGLSMNRNRTRKW